MAGRPIEIEIGINADNVDRGTDQVVDGLDNIQDALRDVDRTADRTADNMSDGMSDTGRAIRRDLTQALDDVADRARTTGRTVDREMSDGADRASEGFNQMSDDAASNAQEIAGSFDGSAESLVDGFQGAAAEMFSGFGPAGMAAGLAIAAGIGLAMAALQGNADLVNENKEKILDLAQTIKENGGALSEADYIQSMEDYGYAIQDTKEWWEIFQEDAVSGFEEISKLAKDAGIDLKTAFNGAFGSIEDTEKGLEIINKKLTTLKEKKDAVYQTEGSIMDPVDETTLGSLEKLRGKMEENKKVQQEAIETEKIRRQAIEGTVTATLEDIEALRKKNDLLQEGITTELDYRDQVDQTNATIAENGATLDINTQKGRDNQRALMDQSDAAQDMARSQLEAGVSADVVAANLANQREAILLSLDAMTGSRAESERYAQSLGLIPTEVITEVKSNGSAETKAEIDTIPATKETDVTVTETGSAEVDARIQSIEGKEVLVEVDDNYQASEVQRRIDNIQGKEVLIEVDDNYQVSEVQKRINGLQGKTVDIDVRIANYADIQRSLDNLTAARSVTVTVNEKLGQGSGV